MWHPQTADDWGVCRFNVHASLAPWRHHFLTTVRFNARERTVWGTRLDGISLKLHFFVCDKAAFFQQTMEMVIEPSLFLVYRSRFARHTLTTMSSFCRRESVWRSTRSSASAPWWRRNLCWRTWVKVQNYRCMVSKFYTPSSPDKATSVDSSETYCFLQS